MLTKVRFQFTPAKSETEQAFYSFQAEIDGEKYGWFDELGPLLELPADREEALLDQAFEVIKGFIRHARGTNG